MSGDLEKLSSQHEIDKAALENKTVVYPQLNQLQIDIDSDAHWDTFNFQIRVLLQKFNVTKIEMVPSNSGKGHWHATLTLDKIEFTGDRIAIRLLLQACLGSDLKRELLSFFRHETGDEHPTLFLEPTPPNTDLIKREDDIPI